MYSEGKQYSWDPTRITSNFVLFSVCTNVCLHLEFICTSNLSKINCAEENFEWEGSKM